MVLVNNPGQWGTTYWPLLHAPWHGWTPTDLIFPFFLFIVGVSITLALGRRVEQGVNPPEMYGKIARRALIIFALGLFLAGFPYFKLGTLRIPGVLQRIAVCYFVAALLYLHASWKTQAKIAAGLLMGYWFAMVLIPRPGYGLGDLSMGGNLAAVIDRKLLAGHIYRPLYDPEGIFSTIPAIATTIAGVLTGEWLRARRSDTQRLLGLFLAGAAAVLAGWVWNLWFPINKPLWTSSYVLFTAGIALQTLALCYWLIDVQGYRRWAKPFVIFGVNALALYFFSGLMARILTLIKFTLADGRSIDLRRFLFEEIFLSWLPPYSASLGFALSYVLLWLGLMAILYRKQIFIKV